MSSFRWLAVIAFAAILAIGVAACGGGSDSTGSTSGEGGGAPSAEVSGEMAGAGSSAQQAAQEAWIAEFENANSGATVSYDPVGSGGGREQFIAGGVAFAGSDAPLSTDENELEKAEKRCKTAELIQVPDYISPIAIAYNLPEVENLQLSPETLAKIFHQDITKWNDPAIAKDNPGVTLPDTRITPVNRSDDSGTTKNFTEYLSEVVPSVWTDEPDDAWPVKGGEAANGTSGVVEAIAAGEGAIGYADASQAKELQIAKIQVGKSWAEPTPEAAAKILEESPEDPEISNGKTVFAFKLDRKTESQGVYPIVLVSSLIACSEYGSASEAALVKAYLEYAISPEGQEVAATNAGSAPLSASLTKTITPAVESIKAG